MSKGMAILFYALVCWAVVILVVSVTVGFVDAMTVWLSK